MNSQQWLQDMQRNVQVTTCGCVGPQDGQPLCPCRMRGVREVNGRWVETIDHGPVRPLPSPDSITHGPGSKIAREFGRPIDPAAEEGDCA